MNREISLPRVQVSKSTLLVLLGLGIYLAYLQHLGLGKVAESLDHVNLTLFSAALVFSLMMVAFNALSWKRVAEELDCGCGPSLRDLFLIYLASIFMNNLLPSGGFSGETARIYFLSKIDGGSRFDASFASVAASRIITAAPFILGMVLGLAYLIFRYQVPGWALTTCFAMTVLTVSVGFVFVGICFEERWLQRMVGFAVKPFERIFHRELDREVCSGAVSGFTTKMILLRHNNNRALLESFVWAFAGWLCLEAVAFASFRSLEVEISPLAIFAVYSVIVVFQTLPLGLPGGVGLVEIMMTALFFAVGVSIYDAAAVTILIRLVQLWFLALLGGFSTVHLMRRIERDKTGQEVVRLRGIRI